MPLSPLMRIARFPVLGLAALALSSCLSNEDLQRRMDSQNEAFFDLQERREIREDAWEERYEDRYDRIMH